MCKTCPVEIEKLSAGTGISPDEVYNILMNETAFPFNSCEDSFKQAREYIAAHRRGETT